MGWFEASVAGCAHTVHERLNATPAARFTCNHFSELVGRTHAYDAVPFKLKKRAAYSFTPSSSAAQRSALRDSSM